MKLMDNSHLVYSTESGKICPSCQKSISECTCKKKKSRSQTNMKYDGIVRIQREVKGRKGKTVTTVSAFQLADDKLKNLATQLKRRCGTGGSVKDGVSPYTVALLVRRQEFQLIVTIRHRRKQALHPLGVAFKGVYLSQHT